SNSTPAAGSGGIKVAKNEYGSGAGARFNLTFNSSLRTLTVNVTNLSDNNDSGTRTVQVGPNNTNVGFHAGALLGFGFEVNPNSLVLDRSGYDRSTGVANSAYNLPGVSGADSNVPNSFYDPLNFGHAPAYNVDVGVYWDGSSSDRLDAGKGATYVFRFESTNFNSAIFNPSLFWSSNASNQVDFSVVFNSTENKADWDKVAIAFPLMPIPEPSTYGLIGAGVLLGVAVLRRRRRTGV
ncbi:MAG TPA: PEP-CTERM sorting domain-containing protein, partial [Candidatus Synoicihabitans sp.]|nr:PEP-CTERM sorting domain-containing protein [Candidatus Synoicihabitans sp.]